MVDYSLEENEKGMLRGKIKTELRKNKKDELEIIGSKEQMELIKVNTYRPVKKVKKKEIVLKKINKNKSRSTKIIGYQDLEIKATGEIINAQVIVNSNCDTNFEKIFLGHIMEALDVLGSKKFKVVKWLLTNRNKTNNIITITQKDLAKRLNISYFTIASTFKLLIAANFMKKEYSSVYRINPDVIYKGTRNKRLHVLHVYHQGKEQLSLFKERKKA